MIHFDALSLGPLLGMNAETQARFEADTRRARVAHLRLSVLGWLLFYDVYQLASAILMTGPQRPEVGVRLVLVTLVGLAIVAGFGVARAAVREALVLTAALGAVLLSFSLQWLADAPATPASAAEPLLTMVFATVLLLRFPQALVFTTLVVLVGTAGYAFQPGNSPLLAGALGLELLSAGGVALYANYQLQSAERRGYLREMAAAQRSEHLLRDNATLTHLTNIDPLTGVGNRRLFAEHLTRCMHDGLVPQVVGRSLVGLIMLDIDHFKRFNDHYGHLMGDACLREIAQVMNACLCPDRHLLVRYGGEEFAVLVQRTGLDELSALARTLCQAVRERRVTHHHREDGCAVVTVSAGIALASPAMPDLETFLVTAADAAMYDAKHQGRDGYVVSDLAVLV